MQYIILMYGDIVCAADWHVEGVFDFCRMYYAKGGEATCLDAKGSWPLLPGSLYLFPCNSYYRITHQPENPFDVLWFHVGLICGSANETMEIKIEADTLLYYLMQSLSYGMKTPGALVEKLFDALYAAIAPILNLNVADRADIIRICSYINDQMGRECSNRQLAGVLGYSEKYFIRLFTKFVGIQPHQYAMEVRLSHSVKFLMAGKSVKETANLLGYGSAGNFSRDFKARYQLSPRQYVAGFSNKP